MGLFNTFAAMIQAVPAERIVETINSQRRVIEEDIAHQRIRFGDDVYSVLSFCYFISAMRRGLAHSPRALPAKHVEFYGAVVRRLIGAGIFSESVEERFEREFLPQNNFGCLFGGLLR